MLRQVHGEDLTAQGDGQLREGGGFPAVPAQAVDKEEDGLRLRPPEGGGSGSEEKIL